MLTPAEETYLQTIPADKEVTVTAYDPKVAAMAQKLIEKITSVDKDIEVLFMGASALGISGQNDIDLYVLSPIKDFQQHLPSLKQVLGEPSKMNNSSITWSTTKGGFDVEIYLTDPSTEAMQRQIQVFTLLKDNEDLRHEYESLKLTAANQPLREYQRAKYEFYNKILSENGNS